MSTTAQQLQAIRAELDAMRAEVRAALVPTHAYNQEIASEQIERAIRSDENARQLRDTLRTAQTWVNYLLAAVAGAAITVGIQQAIRMFTS